MRFAAFYRNLNLGHPRSPTRTQLECAFVQAGAKVAHSFLTNGTVVFDAVDATAAVRVLHRASAKMSDSCGLREPGFLRPLCYLSELVAQNPFALVNATTVYGCYVTFVEAGAPLNTLPGASARQDVEIISTTPSEIFSVARQLGRQPGSPNAFAEKFLGCPATTRVWNTVVRLLAKHAEQD